MDDPTACQNVAQNLALYGKFGTRRGVSWGHTRKVKQVVESLIIIQLHLIIVQKNNAFQAFSRNKMCVKIYTWLTYLHEETISRRLPDG